MDEITTCSNCKCETDTLIWIEEFTDAGIYFCEECYFVYCLNQNEDLTYY